MRDKVTYESGRVLVAYSHYYQLIDDHQLSLQVVLFLYQAHGRSDCLTAACFSPLRIHGHHVNA